MGSLRFVRAGFVAIALANLILPLRAAHTDMLPPPPGTTASQATPTAAIPPVTAPGPVGPSVTLPPQIGPGQAAPPAPAPITSAPPQGTPLPEGSEPEKSVAQIITAFQEPNWEAPWIFDAPHFASGTGFLIDGNRIMTNAHVVAWTKRLLVRRYHDPKPYFAHVEFVAHDIDLAVIKVEDPSFYDGHEAA